MLFTLLILLHVGIPGNPGHLRIRLHALHSGIWDRGATIDVISHLVVAGRATIDLKKGKVGTALVSFLNSVNPYSL